MKRLYPPMVATALQSVKNILYILNFHCEGVLVLGGFLWRGRVYGFFLFVCLLLWVFKNFFNSVSVCFEWDVGGRDIFN